MKTTKYIHLHSKSAIFLTLLLSTGGCIGETRLGSPQEKNTSDPDKASQNKVGKSDKSNVPAEHEHESGAHGGIIVSLGRDRYHVEAVFDSDGGVRLFTLGEDESQVIDIESQTLKGYVKAEGDLQSKEVAWEAKPQEGDAEGRSSLFVGQLPPEFVGRNVDVTIPNIRIENERFRLGFKSSIAEHSEQHPSDPMPTKIAEDEEQKLYGVASGRYTLSDIAANGNTTPSKKFRGIRSAHDMSPKVGDRICPITQTKANPKFIWIVDGKEYQFCCPPCVDEFVKNAKSSDEPLPEPESYVKK